MSVFKDEIIALMRIALQRIAADPDRAGTLARTALAAVEMMECTALECVENQEQQNNNP